MADFIIAQVFGAGPFHYEACPADQINCNCIMNGVYGATVNLLGAQNIPGGDLFQIDGLCSQGLMDFYPQHGGAWTFYDHGGDGTLLGNCTLDFGDSICQENTFKVITCISSVCGNTA
jgi:hypothetical protein